MKVFVTGGSGFVGTYLCKRLLDQGHRVTTTGTRAVHGRISHDHFRYICADTTEPGPWQDALKESDAAVNLAGKNIFNRWSESYKQQIYDSRIRTTRNLVDALPENGSFTLCSTSAVGYYGDREDDILTESSAPGNDFLARVGIDWEAEAMRAEEKGARVALARFGVVLGRGGGAMEKMVPAFKMFVGGPLGNGRQWFPWIHIDDVIAAAVFVLETDGLSGLVNFTAPEPVRNLDLARMLGEVLGRPAFMPAPAFMLRMALGEFAGTLLASQRVMPEKLLAAGFEFRFSKMRDALQDLV